MTIRNLFLLIVTSSYSGTLLYAQEIIEAPKNLPPGSSQLATMELAKASQNPVAEMNRVPFQFNGYSGGGFGNKTLFQTLF